MLDPEFRQLDNLKLLFCKSLGYYNRKIFVSFSGPFSISNFFGRFDGNSCPIFCKVGLWDKYYLIFEEIFYCKKH